MGVYRLWRDCGYAVGALLAGSLADGLGVRYAIGTIGALTFLSGVIVATVMYETCLPRVAETIPHPLERAAGYKRSWPVLTVGAVVLALIVIPASRLATDRWISAKWRAIVGYRAPSENLPTSQPEKNDALPMAPDFTMFDASGKLVKLSAFRGKFVLLNFWATWCPPCVVEIPTMIQLQRSYSDGAFAVVGVSVDEEGWRAVKPFIAKQGMNYPVLLGDQEVIQRYKDSLPTTLLIDPAGRIAAVHVGLSSKSEYESDLKKFLKQ